MDELPNHLGIYMFLSIDSDFWLDMSQLSRAETSKHLSVLILLQAIYLFASFLKTG